MSVPFIPAHALVTAPGATPARWMLVLHGILGSGANWRSFARRLAEARPAWGFVLVDLRMHGASQGAPPPHTIGAAADDLVRLRDALAVPVEGVLGHSFGGKVALAYAERASSTLDQVWVLDAAPGTRHDGSSETERVIRMLQDFPPVFATRDAFVEAVVKAGLGRAIADWLAMNLRRADDGFRLRLDLDAIEALLESYLVTDLWPVLERAEAARAFHVVVGGRSPAFSPRDRARLAAIAASTPRVHVHTFEAAGHWVHVDAPDALFQAVDAALA